MFTVEVASANGMHRLGECLAGLLPPGSVVCLAGEIGAGKTVFAQGVALGLGVPSPVTSPTFTIIHEYDGRVPFYHIDAYRLETPEETRDLGLEEYLWGKGITAVEWAENIAGLLPSEYLRVNLRPASSDSARLVTFKPVGGGMYQLVEELKKRCLSWGFTVRPQ